MIKNLLLGGAMLLAIPALAQNSGPAGSADPAPTGTTTNDHDPTQTPQDAGTPATDAPAFGSQVNGGVTSSSPGMGTSQAAQGSQSGHAGHGSQMGQGTQGSPVDQGVQSGQTGQSGEIGQTGAQGTTGYQGTGGPAAGARNYPPCSRTVTDSCIQRERRR